jgi:hypothetical protein
MKKLILLAAGLAFVLGTVSFAAPQDEKKNDTSAKKKKKKKTTATT